MHILHLAQYVVNTFSQPFGIAALGREGMTPMKLQKVLYYIKAWSLVEGKDLVDGDFERWPFGPVNAEVYSTYKKYGAQPIPYSFLPFEPNEDDRPLLDFIGNVYAMFSAIDLSVMTHQEDPWKQAQPSAKILPEKILDYYRKQNFARNFPFDPVSKPFYPVQSPIKDSFVFDMSMADREKVQALQVYPSYQYYVEHLQRSSKDFEEAFSLLFK